jgi:uncharacterized protein YjbI with pentapeptide repeats
VRSTAAATAVALLLFQLGCREAPPPVPAAKNEAPSHVSEIEFASTAYVPIAGGSPEPPARLPPARACREAAPSYDRVDPRAGQVNGKLIQGAEGLRRLRRAWGDALVVVRGGDFTGADLRGARLHNLCFLETKFAGSDWRGVRAPGIGFLSSDLTGARLQGARMPRILIGQPHLERVDATGADFSDGSVSGNAMGSWEGLRLDRAVLRRFRFDCGRTQGDQCVPSGGGPYVSFRGADLREAQIDTYWGDSDWRGARLAGTQVSPYQLTQLASARIEGPLIVRENEAKATLSTAEYRRLRSHISNYDPPGTFLKGSRPAWLRPGATFLLAAPPIELDPAARKSPLYRRLLPVLVEGASSVLLVKVRRNGRIDVSGSAVGGNGHMCSLDGINLRFDRSSGWFVGEDQGDQSFGAPAPERPVPIVAFSSDRADIYENGHPWGEKDWGFSHFGLCGARAGFSRMIRLPLSAAEAGRLYRTWD